MNYPHMRAFLVANPKAGRARGERSLATIARHLRAQGLEVVPVTPPGPDPIADALRAALSGESPDSARVIAAGGDGTIHAVLPALAEAGIPLAIVPLGSVNVLARELAIPRAIEAACRVAAGGRLRQIDLGLANGRPFALMAGLGFDAEVVSSVAQEVKDAVGSFAYVAKGLEVLARYPPSRFRVTTESDVIEASAWLAVVSNANHYTYTWRLVPDARIDDGWLDLCLFETDSPARTAGQVLATLRGRHSSHPGVRQLRARSFTFDCQPQVAVQLDGDPAGETPVEITLAPKALTVVVPGQ